MMKLFPQTKASKSPGIAGIHHDYERLQPKKVMSCVTKTSTLEEFMEAYASDLEELLGHLFRADWHH